MKVALLSDIHGNAEALKAVLKDIEKRQVNQIFVLGDLCFRGPQPKESLNLIRHLNAEVIKGNADEWVVRGIEPTEVPAQAFDIMTKERDWTVSQLDDNDINYLDDLPDFISAPIEDIRICLFHGTPNDCFEVIPPDASDDVITEKMLYEDGDIYFYGHIHKAFIRHINGKTVVNLGSVGLPFDGIDKASYALLEVEDDGYQVSIIKVGYDVDKALQQVNDSDYPNRAFLVSVLKNAAV